MQNNSTSFLRVLNSILLPRRLAEKWPLQQAEKSCGLCTARDPHHFPLSMPIAFAQVLGSGSGDTTPSIMVVADNTRFVRQSGDSLRKLAN